MGSVGVLCSHQYLEHIQAFAYYVAKVFWGSDNVESQSGLIWTNEGEILPSPFSETTGIAVEERNAAESGRIATFSLAPVVLDLDRLLAQSFANLEEMP